MTRSTLLKPLLSVTLLLALPAEAVLLYTQLQEATNKVAIARHAHDRQKAEAELADQQAAVALQAANNAVDLKKAEAEKLFAEARAAEEVAANAMERQAAEANIAKHKAEQELQAAFNAERRAAADADKIEAEAITARQRAINSVLRSKAEANVAVAELAKVKANSVMILQAFNCQRYKTARDCAVALRRATANGRFSAPW